MSKSTLSLEKKVLKLHANTHLSKCFSRYCLSIPTESWPMASKSSLRVYDSNCVRFLTRNAITADGLSSELVRNFRRKTDERLVLNHESWTNRRSTTITEFAARKSHQSQQSQYDRRENIRKIFLEKVFILKSSSKALYRS